MRTRLIAVLLITALVSIAVPGFSVDQRTVTITWTPPTHVIVDNDCANLGAALTPEQLADMIYELYISVDGGPYVLELIVQDTEFTTIAYDVGTGIEAYVGAKRPNGDVACFSDHSTFTVPAISVGPCGGPPTFQVN